METFFRLALLVAGVVNLLPALLAALPARLARAYGIAAPDPNLELLLRHRAVLFGLVGGLLVVAAATRRHYGVATAAGVVSMLSFVVLYLLIGQLNPELRRVMLVDVGALALLLGGAAGYYWAARS